MVDIAPCSWGSAVAQVVAAVGAVVTACFTAFLAHRRVKADDAARVARLVEESRFTTLLAELYRLQDGPIESEKKP